MALDKANGWLVLVANIGVIIGVLFLAFELNQNTHIARSAAYREIIEDLNEFRAMQLMDPDLARTYDAFLFDDSATFDDDQMRMLRRISNYLFEIYDYAYYSMNSGIITQEEWLRFRGPACGVWSRHRSRNLPFAIVIDENLISHLNESC